MKQEALSSKTLFTRPIPVRRLMSKVAEKAQINTQEYGRRPYGVGFLVIGYDESGPHLLEFQPSGLVLEYLGTSMGSRSQSARTYIERNLDTFPDSSREELILSALRALRDTLSKDQELTEENVSISVIGKDEKYTLYDQNDTKEWLDKLGDKGPAAARASRAAAEEPQAPTAEAILDSADAMETD